jgi:hypothetical protein
MLDHKAGRLACRNLLATLSVCTTGSTTLVATTTGYTRPAGSFVDDGFEVGMEILPAGFATNTRQVIKNVVAGTILTEGTVAAQASGSGRSLTVGQPEYRAYTNIKYDPKQAAGRPYTEDDWLPGISTVTGTGDGATIIHEPIFVAKIYGLSERGTAALDAYSDSILTLFRPNLSIATSASQILKVKTITPPYKSGITNPSSLPGRALVTVTVPLWAQTTIPT